MTKTSANGAKLSARLCAVQAYYQVGFNKRPFKEVVREFVNDYAGINFEGEELLKPDAAHFKSVVYGADERKLEIAPIIEANVKKGGDHKQLEPLLNSIVTCGTYELLSMQDIDSPIIINDYIEVTKAFYTDGEAGLVNGILDAISTVVRA